MRKVCIFAFLIILPLIVSACNTNQGNKGSAPIVKNILISPNPAAPGSYVLVTIEAIDPMGGHMNIRVSTGESLMFDGTCEFVMKAQDMRGSQDLNFLVGNGFIDTVAKSSLNIDDTLPPSTMRSGRVELPANKSFDFFSGSVKDQYYGDIDYVIDSYSDKTLSFRGNQNGGTSYGFDGGVLNATNSDSNVKDLSQVVSIFHGDYYDHGHLSPEPRRANVIKVGDVLCFWLKYSSSRYGKIKVVSFDDNKIVFDWILQVMPENMSFFENPGGGSSGATPVISPGTPIGLVATAEYTNVKLSWAPNTEPDLIGYWIYRSTSSGTGFVKVKSEGLTPNSVDSSIGPNTTYYYKIKAINSSYLESDYSSEISVTTGASPVAVPPGLDDKGDDDFSYWNNSGFTVSILKYSSPYHSYFAGSGNNLNTSMTLKAPIPISGIENLEYNINYNTEVGYDYFFVEVSESKTHWDIIASYNGNSGGWTAQKMSLASYAGKSIYVRLRYSTDEYISYDGVYVDDILIH